MSVLALVRFQEEKSEDTLLKQAIKVGASMWLKERAMNMLSEGITIADMRLPDNPLIFANQAFYVMTGYSYEETLGKNCRFLQGPDTDPAQVGIVKFKLEFLDRE